MPTAILYDLCSLETVEQRRVPRSEKVFYLTYLGWLALYTYPLFIYITLSKIQGFATTRMFVPIWIKQSQYIVLWCHKLVIDSVLDRLFCFGVSNLRWAPSSVQSTFGTILEITNSFYDCSRAPNADSLLPFL